MWGSDHRTSVDNGWSEARINMEDIEESEGIRRYAPSIRHLARRTCFNVTTGTSAFDGQLQNHANPARQSSRNFQPQTRTTRLCQAVAAYSGQVNCCQAILQPNGTYTEAPFCTLSCGEPVQGLCSMPLQCQRMYSVHSGRAIRGIFASGNPAAKPSRS